MRALFPYALKIAVLMGVVGSLTVANARVSLSVTALGKTGETCTAVNNLFDTNYQYNAGYPMPGRNFRVGLIASF